MSRSWLAFPCCVAGPLLLRTCQVPLRNTRRRSRPRLLQCRPTTRPRPRPTTRPRPAMSVWGVLLSERSHILVRELVREAMAPPPSLPRTFVCIAHACHMRRRIHASLPHTFVCICIYMSLYDLFMYMHVYVLVRPKCVDVWIYICLYES